jgi:hypothetical protein
MFKSKEEQASATTSIVVPATPRYEVPIITTGDKFVTAITDDLTFFDVREINDKILLIFIDQKGQKKYLVTDYNLHFYVKNANWNQCNQITDQVDGIVHISGREKSQVIKYVRDKLNLIKSGR